MVQASSTAPLPIPIRPSEKAVRIVLFGMPAAGKTSLLGALKQAAQTQELSLNGKLHDLTHRLEELQRKLYENRGHSTLEEIVPYPIRYEPLSGRAVEAVLYDCDGRVANEIIREQKKLAFRPGENSLARAVLEADTLILVVDAAAPAEQVEADFQEFGQFLDIFERHRGEHIEISGLPVFLVLTKCDLLAQPGDSSSIWMERIEERKDTVHRGFQEFLAKDHGETASPFGRIHLHLWATSVKRPALSGPPFPSKGNESLGGSRDAIKELHSSGVVHIPLTSDPEPARPREPYGVAELFRQALDHAQRFRTHQRRSSRMLFTTVLAGTGILMAMCTLIFVLLAVRPHPLRDRVPAYEPDASVRLAGPVTRLEHELRDLRDLQREAEFPTLPKSDRDRVERMATELDEFIPIYTKVQTLVSGEGDHSFADLDAIRLSPEREEEWSKTETVADLQTLRKVRAREIPESPINWYSRLHDKAQNQLEKVPTAPNRWRSWHEQVDALVKESLSPPYVEDDTIPNSRIRYRVLLDFSEIKTLKKAWEEVDRPMLLRLKDITSALGLSEELPGNKYQPLEVLPSGKPKFSAQEWTDRRQSLVQFYPRHAMDFTLRGLPDKCIPHLKETARTRYENALKPAQELLLEQLQTRGAGDVETRERWLGLLDWLNTQSGKALADWRIIAGLLLRLHNDEARDPIDDFGAFLEAKNFPFKVKSVVVEIPYSSKFTPGNSLTFFYPSKEKSAFSLRKSGDGDRDDEKKMWRYTFETESEQSLRYEPGEHLSARLALKDTRQILSWAAVRLDGRSNVYQYQSLFLDPWLMQNENADPESGESLGDIRMRVQNGTPFRALPDLFPAVFLKKK